MEERETVSAAFHSPVERIVGYSQLIKQNAEEIPWGSPAQIGTCGVLSVIANKSDWHIGQ